MLETEEPLGLFVQHMPAAVAMMDESFAYIMVSSRWASDFGLNSQHIKGHSHFDYFDDREHTWRSVFRRALQGTVHQGDKAPITRTTGRTYWVNWEVRPWYRKDGNLGGLIMFAEDKTERKLAIDALKRSETNLRAIFNNSIQSFVLVAPDYTVQAANRIARERARLVFGRDLSVGDHFMDFVFEEDMAAFTHDFGRAMRGESVMVEKPFAVGDSEAWFQFHYTPAYEDDAVVGVCFSAIDITERKQALKALERHTIALENRNQELQEFAYVASHDLQEPLRKIRAFADLVRDDYAALLDETGRYYLQRIQDGAERMAHLMSDLLAYTRVTTRARSFEVVDLNRTLSDVRSDLELPILETEAVVEIGDLPSVKAEPTQMHQLFQNLVANALKFHKKDLPPHIQVEGNVLEKAPGQGDSHAQIVVRDKGVGFDQKYADRIFSPFQRLHARDAFPGTGMGLAICRRIIERHNGWIRAESEPGIGTAFIVQLPLEQVREEG